ncbi:uncharacterized protein BXZ73DRAFT_86440 [Epithele typhae]|uniref:uncharacterized protein n=1 Tax=Epithele typhae TaxID=378194 RepID=UPI002007C181|nr:uncharacterized protein BXZ73DRAFT_86440 [Epithele typhae]KAH9946279.1 hypothetical protein BXZ73DRAFT_86440 [Epithele typhae]
MVVFEGRLPSAALLLTHVAERTTWRRREESGRVRRGVTSTRARAVTHTSLNGCLVTERVLTTPSAFRLDPSSTRASVPMSVMTETDMNNEKLNKPLLVELKNGKLVFKQKSLSFEKMSETMQEIVKFREMLEQMLEAKEPPLSAIPEEHKPVVAKLVQESDKTLQALSKHVQQELLPVVDEDDEDATAVPAILPTDVLEAAVRTIAKRVNYGLDPPVEGSKVPAAWHIWRWEVQETYRGWLPKAVREKAENRTRERQQLKHDVQTLFDSLSDEERISILGVRVGRPRRAPLGLKPQVALPSAPTPSENDAPDHGPEKKSMGRPKKPVDLAREADKTAKEKEKQDKKTAKAEREKKEKDAQAKSRSLMANFFGKAKSASIASPSKLKAADGESGSPAPSQSDFERTFRAFSVKKDAELAPHNWFRERRWLEKRRQKRQPQGDVIIIDDDDDHMEDTEDVLMADATDGISDADIQLDTIMTRLGAGLNPPRRPRQPTGFKTYHPLSVRGLMAQLTEAEVAGDDTEVRRLLSLIRDRSVIPAKVLVFKEDARPGYFGTHTRNSREIGPRTPFARDPVQIDYSYDSGEEWAEEEGEADDVMEDVDEDGDDGDEPDSDMDSWLVDDDDIEDPGTPIEDRPSSPGFPDFDSLPSGSGSGNKKRKEKERERPKEEKVGSNKKRRVVVPLVAFTKGPEWETTVGRCSYGPFNAYRIQLFNDTPSSIDPFTFTADGFVIPALPAHLAKPTTSSSVPITDPTSAPAKRAVPTPKTAFPDAHLPVLLSRIEELATPSFQGIVEAVHRELQAHKVKKNAIAMKVREVGEKCKERKIWVVRPEIRVRFGLSMCSPGGLTVCEQAQQGPS